MTLKITLFFINLSKKNYQDLNILYNICKIIKWWLWEEGVINNIIPNHEKESHTSNTEAARKRIQRRRNIHPRKHGAAPAQVLGISPFHTSKKSSFARKHTHPHSLQTNLTLVKLLTIPHYHPLILARSLVSSSSLLTSVYLYPICTCTLVPFSSLPLLPFLLMWGVFSN